MPRPPRSRILRSICALGVLVVLAVAVAQLAGVSSRRSAPPGTRVFDGVHEQWLVKAPGVSARSLGRAARPLGGGSAKTAGTGGWYAVQLGDEVAAADAEAAFGAAGATAVEPVLPRLPYDERPSSVGDSAAVPNAPATRAGDQPTAVDDGPAAFGDGTELRTGPLTAARLGEQWALTQTSDEDIDGPEAWQASTGAGAVVAVIDTGVDASHPDLAGRVLAGRDFSHTGPAEEGCPGTSTPATVDRLGHGTQVASVIAANGTTIAGIAPDARILPLKVFADSASCFSMAGYLSAIRFAADQGVDAINISLGCGGTPSCYSEAELEALTYATERGVVVVAAAGNGDRYGHGMDNDAPATPDFPSGYELPGIVAVTSSNRGGDWSRWSNYGASGVDLAAPGEGILVAAPGNGYRTVTGTSFSAPYAAGVAALVAAKHPGASATDVAARLLQGTIVHSGFVGRTATGGVLNADAALVALGEAAGGGPVAGTVKPSNPKSGARLARPPVLAWTVPSGWTSLRVRIAGPGPDQDIKVAAASRALAHPAASWRSGTYRWQVIARAADGRTVASTPRTYTITPRLGAWVTSGRVRRDGRSMRLRIGYAASEPRATVRVVISANGRVLHSGRARNRTEHVRGVGSPRRGWFGYEARISRKVAAGQRVTVEVRVSVGSTRLTRRFRATVS